MPNFYSIAEAVIEDWISESYDDLKDRAWKMKKPSEDPFFFTRRGWRQTATNLVNSFNSEIQNPIEVHAYEKDKLRKERLQTFQAFISEKAAAANATAKARAMLQ